MEQGKKGTAYTQQEIEQHLQSALAAAAPDIWPRLKLQIQAEQAKGRESMSVESQRKGKILTLHRRLKRLAAAAAACICLTAFGGGYYHYQYVQVASQVEIDVNPSLKLSLNRKERVVKAEALNEDGAALLEGNMLTGRNVTEAVDQVVDSLVDQGYLRQGKDECALLVSVAGKDSKQVEQLKTSVSQDMEAALAAKEVSAVVYDQVIQVTQELEELADTYQVSLGKAEFVGQLIQENQDLSQEQQDAYSRMMGQTMEELNREIGEKSYSLSANVTIIKAEAVASPDRSPDEPEQETRAQETSGQEEDRASAGKAEEKDTAQTEHIEEESSQALPEIEGKESLDPEEASASLQEEPAGAIETEEETIQFDEPEKDISQPESGESQEADEPESSAAETESQLPDETAVHEPATDASSIVEAQGEKEASAVPVGAPEHLDDSALSRETEAEESVPSSEETEGEAPSQETLEDREGSAQQMPKVPEPVLPVPEESDTPSQSEPESQDEASLPAAEDEERTPVQSQEEGTAPAGGEERIDDSDSAETHEAQEDMAGENQEPETREEGKSQVIPAASGERDDFGPGDASAPLDVGKTVTENGTVIIAGEEEKKEWREPVYASQMLSGYERSLLQKGPGMFFGRIAEDGQESLLQYGPGFAYLYEGEHYRGSDYTRVRIKPSKGQVYRVNSDD